MVIDDDDVHGSGNTWDPMGPVGFPRQWEW